MNKVSAAQLGGCLARDRAAPTDLETKRRRKVTGVLARQRLPAAPLSLEFEGICLMSLRRLKVVILADCTPRITDDCLDFLGGLSIEESQSRQYLGVEEALSA